MDAFTPISTICYFIQHLTAPWSTLGHSYQMLITAFYPHCIRVTESLAMRLIVALAWLASIKRQLMVNY